MKPLNLPDIPYDVTGGVRRFCENIRSWIREFWTDTKSLTDDSMADTLHRHSELSASDGTPNPAVQVDATGNMSVLSGRVTQQGIFAGIHVADGSSAQSIPNGTTYTKLTCFTENGSSSNCTADYANDKITFTKTGYYLCFFTFSGTLGTNNVVVKMSAFLNGTEQHQVHSMVKFLAAGDHTGCVGIGSIDVTTAGWDLDLRTRHDNGGAVNLTGVYVNMFVEYMGET